MKTLLEQCQAPCAAHAEAFGKLRQALAEELAGRDTLTTAQRRWQRDPCVALQETLESLHHDCADCRAATLENARAYAQTHPAPVLRLAPTAPLIRSRRRVCGEQPQHTHNALGGCIYLIPASLFKGVDRANWEDYKTAYRGSEWVAWASERIGS